MPAHVKAPPTVSDINVTPLVDCMLVLLIIFMVITPLLQKNISVDLVQTRNPRAMPDDEHEDVLEIAITRDGKMYLRRNPIQADEITPKIRDLIAGKLDKTVYLRADSRAKYGDVEKVVMSVRAAGVDSLALITQRLQQPGEAAVAGP
jgi:biopolymer transport protein ExbD/biopolymer transport protein TolR